VTARSRAARIVSLTSRRPPTGQRIDFEGVTIVRVVDGQIREGWNRFDFLTMYQQLGVELP